MNSTTHSRIHGTLRGAASRGIAIAVLAAMVTGCSVDEILEVQDVDVATPASLRSASTLPIVLGGAISAFQVGYFGTGNVNESSGQVGYSGLLSDEIRSSDTFPTRNEIDQRNIQLDNSSNEAQFIALSRARAAADLAIRRFAEFGPDSVGFALAYALDGYSTIFFAENYCSGVPFSTMTDEGAIQYGMPLTTTEMLQRAVAKFDSALALDQITDDVENLALVGKARALLDLEQYAEAATVAAQVDKGFEYIIAASATTSRQNNGVWTFFQNTARFSAADKEGLNGLPYFSDNDPRVKITDEKKVGFDKTTPLFLQQKYPTRDSGVPLASWEEAQLIIAEAQLKATPATDDWFTTLNDIRTANGMAPLSVDPSTLSAAQKVDLLFKERAYWLWLTSHRLGDLRRLVRQYDRTAETVFPTGAYHKNGDSYGTDVNLPVPNVELNNPKFTGCIDRNA